MKNRDLKEVNEIFESYEKKYGQESHSEWLEKFTA